MDLVDLNRIGLCFLKCGFLPLGALYPRADSDRVLFGWLVVFFGALGFREMKVPRAMPPLAVLPFLGPFVGYAVRSVVPTG